MSDNLTLEGPCSWDGGPHCDRHNPCCKCGRLIQPVQKYFETRALAFMATRQDGWIDRFPAIKWDDFKQGVYEFAQHLDDTEGNG